MSRQYSNTKPIISSSSSFSSKPSISTSKSTIDNNANPDFDISSEILAIIGATFSGAKYGVKIRFPHALVMTFLFRKGIPTQEKIRIIVKSTLEHSRNLASFATLYKCILFLLKWTSIQLRKHNELEYRNKLISRVGNTIATFIVDGPYNQGRRLIPRPPGIPEKSQHAAIAGFIGGYTIWGKYSSINYQIVLYLTSRVIIGLTTLASRKKIPPFCWKSMTKKNVYPFKAAVVWSIVMVLFESNPDVLHPSLKKSMDEIYRLNDFAEQGKK